MERRRIAVRCLQRRLDLVERHAGRAERGAPVEAVPAEVRCEHRVGSAVALGQDDERPAVRQRRRLRRDVARHWRDVTKRLRALEGGVRCHEERAQRGQGDHEGQCADRGRLDRPASSRIAHERAERIEDAHELAQPGRDHEVEQRQEE